MTGLALLRSDSLQGVRLGISVSESPDLERLGLAETHFRLALGELVRAVLISGGSLSYGGHLKLEGYTSFMLNELHRFGRRNRPFTGVLAWQEHRRIGTTELENYVALLGLYGSLVALSQDGKPIDPYHDRPADPIVETDLNVISESLTSMRCFIRSTTDARLFLGGKRCGYQGKCPGILEEAIQAVEAGQPAYFAGGFGGVTADITRLINMDGGPWLPPDPAGQPVDANTEAGLQYLHELWRKNGAASGDNGLTQEEQRMLALSHRPSEIAALVSLGLGRRLSR